MCFRIVFDIKCCIFTADKIRPYQTSGYAIVPVISYGTVVEIPSTRCDGIKECWDNSDELDCGFSTHFTVVAGM